ncbi:MAG: hypothetical protein IPP72_14755 [Chitinophagaceae bacterium]|nr:hypothetical protein [Chitinophagaceae bacterium]
MDTLYEQIAVEIPGEGTNSSGSGNHSNNPGLRALLSIRNLSITLEKDYAELLQIEASLQEINKNALLIIETNCSPEAIESWLATAREVDSAITGLNETLNVAKEKLWKKEEHDLSGLWNQLALYLTLLKESCKKTVDAGFRLLPETSHPAWEKDFKQIEVPALQAVITHIESCRVLLQMIERYTPDELNKITKIIVDQIPLDFTYEEALLYQKDYYKALINFKKEFKEEKNLWDKFLDILAGGTHQSPSERVMLERWIEGEKGELD